MSWREKPESPPEARASMQGWERGAGSTCAHVVLGVVPFLDMARFESVMFSYCFVDTIFMILKKVFVKVGAKSRRANSLICDASAAGRVKLPANTTSEDIF